MKLRRGLRLSLRALAAHRLRAALALACVAVGSAGVLLTSALGEGASREVQRDVEASGRNLLVVRPARVERGPLRREVSGLVTSLRPEDASAIADLTAVTDVAPAVDAGARLQAGGGALPVGVLGTTEALARVRGFVVSRGRFLDGEDERSSRRVVVLGARVAETLFGREDPVGRELRLRGLPFEVVGVLAAKGLQKDGSDQDGTVFVPLQTALRRLLNRSWLSAIFVSVVDHDRMDEADAQIRRVLRERHRSGVADDFEVQDQARLLRTQQEAIRSMTLLTSGLAATALLVGAFGILALMLLSLKERRAEIGLRMAVGARSRDVLLQFAAEAVLLALGGWLAGAALAAGAGMALARTTEWRLALPGAAVAASLLGALASGLAGGAWPARRAARLQPIVALSGRS